jgi:hypothetical protein
MLANNAELKISAFDIFNNRNQFSQIVGSDFIETVESQVLKRSLAFSFIYHLRKSVR